MVIGGPKSFCKYLMPKTQTVQASPTTWDDTMSTLHQWIPAFQSITEPRALSFDSAVAVMEASSGGMPNLSPALLDCDGVFIEKAIGSFIRPPQQVIIIPDCAMVSRLPHRFPVSSLSKFISDFDDPASHLGLFDGASDILFAFDTADMILVDHDERIWITQANPH